MRLSRCYKEKWIHSLRILWYQQNNLQEGTAVVIYSRNQNENKEGKGIRFKAFDRPTTLAEAVAEG